MVLVLLKKDGFKKHELPEPESFCTDVYCMTKKDKLAYVARRQDNGLYNISELSGNNTVFFMNISSDPLLPDESDVEGKQNLSLGNAIDELKRLIADAKERGSYYAPATTLKLGPSLYEVDRQYRAHAYNSAALAALSARPAPAASEVQAEPAAPATPDSKSFLGRLDIKRKLTGGNNDDKYTPAS
jgi:hypothetical protein